MVPDNDNDNDCGQPGDGERRVPPAGPRREQSSAASSGSSAPASAGPHRETSRAAAEERILREGEAARLALARQTAREALANPGVLDAKRLIRLGPDGLARFVAELRLGALGTAKPADPPARKPATPARPSTVRGLDGGAITPHVAPNAAPPAAAVRRRSDQPTRSGSAGPHAPVARPTPAPPPTAPTPRSASFAGWWQSQKDRRLGFEARARRWGCLAGTFLIIACLVFLARTHR